MFTFGTDPEFMLAKDGAYYSAIGIVPGTKEDRHQLGKHEVFYDNVLAECAICPGGSKEETIENIGDCLAKYARLVSPYKIILQSAQKYPVKELKHKDAMEAGCDPETCAYTTKDLDLRATLGPLMKKSPLRTAGGHVHLGADVAKTSALDGYGDVSTVRMMDLFLGVPSIYIDHDRTSKERKQLYGQAGRFRSPKYGIEYRSLGNFWLASPFLVSLIYDLCEFVLKFVEERRHEEWWEIDMAALDDDENWNKPSWRPGDAHTCHGYDAKELQNVINKMDKNKGKKFLDMIFNLLPKELQSDILEASEPVSYDPYEEWSLK